VSVSFGPVRSCSLRVFGFVRSGFRVRFRFTALELEDGLGRTQFYHCQEGRSVFKEPSLFDGLLTCCSGFFGLPLLGSRFFFFFCFLNFSRRLRALQAHFNLCVAVASARSSVFWVAAGPGSASFFCFNTNNPSNFTTLKQLGLS
jgi:hypothetical protein